MPKIRRPRTENIEPEELAYGVGHVAEPSPAVAVTEQPEAKPKRDVSEIVSKRAEESALLMEAAEEVLTAIARGQNVSPAERSLLITLGIIGQRLESEVNRLKRVLSWQERAGTADERPQATEAAEQAADRLAERGPEIAAEVERLRGELVGLQQAAEQTTAVCKNQAEAVRSLSKREMLPVSVQQEADATKQEVGRIESKIATLRGEIELTAALAQCEVTDRLVVDYAGNRRLDCYSRKQSDKFPGSIIESVDADAWQRHLSERRRDDQERRAEIERLEPELQPLIEKRDVLLSFYVP